MTDYTFDVKLDAAFTVKAESEEAARKMLASVLDCASINCGMMPGPSCDPLVGEATMTRADLGLIDGEEAPLPEYPSPLHYFAAARGDGWYTSDEDTPEQYCDGNGVEEDDIKNADIRYWLEEFREYEAEQGR
jgi:hypothetical protein